MSFKDGIPLLKTLDDEDEDEDFSVEISSRSRYKWGRRHVLFAVVLAVVVFLLLAVIVAVTVPVVLLQGGGGKSSSDADSSERSSLHISPSMSQFTSTLSSPSTSSQISQFTSTLSSPSTSQVSQFTSTLSSPSTSSQMSHTMHTSTHLLSPSPSTSQISQFTSTLSSPSTSSQMSQFTSTLSSPSTSSQMSYTMHASTHLLSPSPTTSSQISQFTSTLSSPSTSSQMSQFTSTLSSPSTSSQMSHTMHASTHLLSPSPSSSSSLMSQPSISLPSPSHTWYPTSSPVLPTSTQIPLSPTPSPTTTPEGINQYKPVSDDRQYKVLTLHNSLRVVLVSDPNSNISAASMEVAAGSFSDPPEAEGLAHFCEHMLFLGTQKYPDPHGYSNFLSTHGGYDNAFTSTQETNYYFSVDSAYLEHSLDLFAQFFIGPLFEASSVEDEVHAVNAEHEKNLQSDGWKAWQLLKHVSNPWHPFHMFSTGTLSTLNNTRTPLLPLLHHYYNSSYSANTLQLAVYGRDSLDTLIRWVKTYFTGIPNRSVSPQTFQTTAFPPEYRGKLVFYYPVADTNTLALYWQTQPLESRYRNDVIEFVSRYIGYEGPGSILQYLKKNKWATSLSAGSEVDADSFTLFVVSMELTEKGLGEIPHIIQNVFHFIRLLSNASLQTLWDDHVAVSQVVYDYSEPEEPSDYAQSISERMRLVENPSDLLGDPRRWLLNQTLVHSVLQALSPNNSIVFLGTHHVNFSESLNLTLPHYGPPVQDHEVTYPWPDLDEIEPIYTTPFAEVNTTSELIDYWEMESTMSELYLPGKNNFIPGDFSILPPPPKPTTVPVRVNLTSVKSGVSLWWLQDTSFHTPHINMFCTMEASEPEPSSVRWSELTTLYSLMVAEVIAPILYPAKELTYSTSLYATPTGLHLEFSGFSDPQVMERYINTTVTNMKNYPSLREVFDIVSKQRTVFLENYQYTASPYSYIYRYLQQVILERPYWKHEEELNETNNITPDDVINHAKMLFSNASFLCFSHGNINQDQAEQYTELVVRALSPSLSLNPTPGGSYQRQRVNLTEPGSYSVTIPTLNPSDQNSAVNVVYQIGPACTMMDSSDCSSESISTSAHLGLLAHIIGDECFYQLRTVEQLGYVVFCFQTSYSGIATFQVVVQSQEYNASYVLREINLFLENFGTSTIANMTDQSLQDKKNTYSSALRQKSQTLADESDRLWSEITTGREQFDFNDQLLRGLSTINTHSLQEFYGRYITDSAQYRKLVLGVYGEDKMVDFSHDSTYCIDYDTLDHSVFAYPTSNQSNSCLMS